MREHGTKACYVFGPEPGGDRSRGCRCEACRKANRASENNRNRQIAYGRWQPYVDAERTRGHLRMLGEAGIGWKRAAQLSGVANGSVSKILFGGPGDRPPTRRVRPATEAAILSVRPSLDVLADSAATDPAGTVRRIQALVASGWSQSRIARRLGMTPANFSAILYRRPMVTAATARAVRDLYQTWQFRPPPEGAHREKIAASRARGYAAARGWPPPAAWDDIDDPQAFPAEGWQRGTETGRLPGAELAAEARKLEELGLTRPEAAARLGLAPASLSRAMSRHPEAGEAA